MTLYKTKLISLLSILFLVGCASKYNDVSSSLSIQTIDNNNLPISADLINTDDGWRLTNINLSNSREISFPSMYPNFADSYISKGCFRAIFGLFGGCDTKGPHQEFSYEVWDVRTIEGSFWHLVFAPIGIRSRENFDWDKYESAIAEAIDADNWDKIYPEISKSFYSEYMQAKSFKFPDIDLSHFSDKAEYLRQEAEKNIKDIITKNQILKFLDKSSFWGEYSGGREPDLSSLVQLDISLLAPDPTFIDPRKQLIEYIDFDDYKLINGINANEFYELITKDIAKRKDIKMKNKNITLKNQKIIEEAMEKNNNILESYSKDLTKLNALGTFSLLRSGNSLKEKLSYFNYDIQQTKSVEVNNGKLKNKPTFTLIINSLKNKRIFPTNYTANNSDISVILINNQIKVTNNTSKYITLDAISLFHKDDVLTIGGEKFQNFREIAPNSTTSISLNEFNLNSLDTNYRNITKQNLKNININFGFSFKYKVSESISNKTLYKLQKYSLYEILKNR